MRNTAIYFNGNFQGCVPSLSSAIKLVEGMLNLTYNRKHRILFYETWNRLQPITLIEDK